MTGSREICELMVPYRKPAGRNVTVEEKNEMRELCGQLAAENFRNGLNCSESVYNALLRAGALEGVDPDTQALCIGFGGGIGLSGHTCGALCALVMANGALYGRKDPYQVPEETRMSEIADRYYRRYNDLVWNFKKTFGSTTCEGIGEEFEDWHCKERRKKCMKLIIGAAKMGCDYLMMKNEKAFALPYGKNMGNRE